MRTDPSFLTVLLSLLIISATTMLAFADEHGNEQGAFTYELQLDLSHQDLDARTLGDDATQDRLQANELTLEFDMQYQPGEHWTVFFGGNFFNQRETLKSANQRDKESGFERGETGLGYSWGEQTTFELALGRLEFSESRAWWWEENLDALRLQLERGNLTFMLALGEESGPLRSNLDTILADEKGIIRRLASLGWQVAGNHQMNLRYLDHDDRSRAYLLNASIAESSADEEDADLHWVGLEYLGSYRDNRLGLLNWMLGYATLRGRATSYEFSAPVAGLVDVDAIEAKRFDANARELSIGWTPATAKQWQFVAALATGSGDSDTGDAKITSFRQTGLHENAVDYNYYGELYQPELSNIRIASLGLMLELNEAMKLSLLHYDYRQAQLDTEMRDVAIELETNGINKALGSETDLIAAYQFSDDLTLELVLARFEAGRAYGSSAGKSSRYWSLDLGYSF